MYSNQYNGKKVLITGGLGFIGSNLAIKLAQLGSQITVVDSLIPDYGGNLFNIDPVRDHVKVNISDVRDRSSIDYLVQGQDFLFNLAGTLSHIDSMRDPFTDLDVNCRGQLNVLEACRKISPAVKIVFPGVPAMMYRLVLLMPMYTSKYTPSAHTMESPDAAE